jgi:phosphatidylinositol phospholipase C delta
MLSRPELLQLFMRYAKKMNDETPEPADISLAPLPSSSQAPISPLSTSPPTVSPPSIDTLGTQVTQKLSASPQFPGPAMSLDGFSSFLLSSDNSTFSDQQGKISHDMTRPLSDYFVSSSHNTYLTGHQLIGSSTIEGYIRALLHSCRSVECKCDLLPVESSRDI